MGQLIEQGSHNYLLEQEKGVYKKMWEKQGVF